MGNHAKAWKEQAACKGKTNLFFVNRGDKTSMKLAKAICQTCPVIVDCRDHVTCNPERFGIWAGMTEKDRRAYRLRNIYKAQRRR